MNVGLPAPEPAIVREFGHLITENANEKVVIVQQFDELFEKAMKLRSKAFLLDIFRPDLSQQEIIDAATRSRAAWLVSRASRSCSTVATTVEMAPRFAASLLCLAVSRTQSFLQQ